MPILQLSTNLNMKQFLVFITLSMATTYGYSQEVKSMKIAQLQEYIESRPHKAVVNFWATWCAPCRAEIPDLVKLQTQYKDHLVIIGVLSEDEPGPHVSKFVADYKINYPIVPETKEMLETFTGIYALPTTFMVGPDLRIMQKHIGQIRPAQIELETRVLAKLPVDAQVEFEPDNKDAVLKSNARATEIPGVDLAVLTADQRTIALNRLNDEPCDCGCGLTIAQCRINDSTCAVSPKLAEKILAEVKAAK